MVVVPHIRIFCENRKGPQETIFNTGKTSVAINIHFTVILKINTIEYNSKYVTKKFNIGNRSGYAQHVNFNTILASGGKLYNKRGLCICTITSRAYATKFIDSQDVYSAQ